MALQQKLKQSIYATSKKISKEVATASNMQIENDVLEVIAELTYKKLLLYGYDLDAFQKHAKRSTVNAEDVKLLVRRNESLKQIIEGKIQRNCANKQTEASTSGPAKKKRKTTL